MSKRLLSWTLAGVFVAGSFVIAPMTAQAGSKGRRNTAAVMTGIAGYNLLRGNTKTGLLWGAGAAYAWKRHSDARKAEKRRARYMGYRSSYGSTYRTSAYSGRTRSRRSRRHYYR